MLMKTLSGETMKAIKELVCELYVQKESLSIVKNPW